MELTLHQTIEKESHKTYGQVNRMWPDEIPPITKEEAFKAYKLLTRKFGSKKVWSEYYNKWETKKLYIGRRRPRRCWICLSGNCNLLDRGWRRLVHDISHRVYDFRFPQSSRDHNIAQAKIEQEMAQYVIDSGWLEGKLKSKPKVNPNLKYYQEYLDNGLTPAEAERQSRQTVKVNHLIKLIRSWERKETTAKTYIKKYRLKLKRLRPTMGLEDLII